MGLQRPLCVRRWLLSGQAAGPEWERLAPRRGGDEYSMPEPMEILPLSDDSGSCASDRAACAASATPQTAGNAASTLASGFSGRGAVRPEADARPQQQPVGQRPQEPSAHSVQPREGRGVQGPEADGGRASPAPDEAIGTKSARRLSVVNADPKQLKAVYDLSAPAIETRPLQQRRRHTAKKASYSA